MYSTIQNVISYDFSTSFINFINFRETEEISKENTTNENFVQQDYNQIDFNVYKHGPGSDLNDIRDSKSCTLCLKHVPVDLKMESIKNMLSKYGTLENIHPFKNKTNTEDKCQLVFVTFESVR